MRSSTFYGAILGFASAVLGQTPGFNPILSPTQDQTLKSGEDFKIVWQHAGAADDAKVTIKLLQGQTPSTLQIGPTITANHPSKDGQFTWSVPRTLEVFETYGFSISLDNDPAVFQYSFPFHITGLGDANTPSAPVPGPGPAPAPAPAPNHDDDDDDGIPDGPDDDKDDGIPDGPDDKDDGIPDGPDDNKDDGIPDGPDDDKDDGIPDGPDDKDDGIPDGPDDKDDGIPDGPDDKDDGIPDGPDDKDDGIPDGPDDKHDGIPDGPDDDKDDEGILSGPDDDKDDDGIPDGPDDDNDDDGIPDGPDDDSDNDDDVYPYPTTGFATATGTGGLSKPTGYKPGYNNTYPAKPTNVVPSTFVTSTPTASSTAPAKPIQVNSASAFATPMVALVGGLLVSFLL